jgi:hypothetical protein
MMAATVRAYVMLEELTGETIDLSPPYAGDRA